jgi:hypothetical protein
VHAKKPGMSSSGTDPYLHRVVPRIAGRGQAVVVVVPIIVVVVGPPILVVLLGEGRTLRIG